MKYKEQVKELEKKLRIAEKVIEQLKGGRNAEINELKIELKEQRDLRRGEGMAYQYIIAEAMRRVLERLTDDDN